MPAFVRAQQAYKDWAAKCCDMLYLEDSPSACLVPAGAGIRRPEILGFQLMPVATRRLNLRGLQS